MIRKLLLIGESGLLQFYLSQDEIKIDRDLLSGFCKAIHSISLELTSPLRHIGFENQTMIVECIDHKDERKLLIAALYDDYHIDEGMKSKVKHVYDKFFANVEFGDETKRISDENMDKEIAAVVNDAPMKQFITNNLDAIKEILDPVIFTPENQICAYSLNSSTNAILYHNSNEDLIKRRTQVTPLDIIKGYLLMWKMETIPQGDKFIGWELPTGLDLADYVRTGEKTLGVVINTSINIKEEPNNEILLYLFGKNALMRSCVPDIEEVLRTRLSQTK